MPHEAAEVPGGFPPAGELRGVIRFTETAWSCGRASWRFCSASLLPTGRFARIIQTSSSSGSISPVSFEINSSRQAFQGSFGTSQRALMRPRIIRRYAARHFLQAHHPPAPHPGGEPGQPWPEPAPRDAQASPCGSFSPWRDFGHRRLSSRFRARRSSYRGSGFRPVPLLP